MENLNFEVVSFIILLQMHKFTQYLLTTMPVEGCVKCLSPQNTFGVSGVNSDGAKSNTIEVNGDRKQHKMPPYCSCGVIQASVSPGIPISNGVIYTVF